MADDKTDPVLPPHRSGAIRDPRLPRANFLASGREGWAALCRLVSATHLAGERGTPVADLDVLAPQSGGWQGAVLILLGEDVAESIEPGTYADPDAVLDALESLDLDADLQDTVVVAEWGRGVVEQLSDAVLDITLTRGDGENEARTLAWEWVRGGPQS